MIETEKECAECDDLGYTYEGGFSMNEEMNIRVRCETCEGHGYDELSECEKR